MESWGDAGQVSKGRVWTGRIISGLVVLLLLFDSLTKIMKVASFMAMAVQSGFTVHEVVRVGWILLICIVLYVIPRTAVLGTVLLTAYLGGAVAMILHLGMPEAQTLFPITVAVLTWIGIYLRERRLWSLVPRRR